MEQNQAGDEVIKRAVDPMEAEDEEVVAKTKANNQTLAFRAKNHR